MRVLSVVVAVLCNAGLLFASVVPSSISREPLMIGTPSQRVSVGVTYEAIKLAVDFDNAADTTLEANSLSAYIGYDVLSWLTVFTTLGGSEIDAAPEVETDPGIKFSVGASAYLWQGDMLMPEYLSGRLTLKATLEFSRYDSDIASGSVDWYDVTAALPLGYECFDDEPESPHGVDTSLSIYIAPAVQYIGGSWDLPGGGSDDFDAHQLFGIIGGIDIFVSPQLSFGAAVNYFDETTIMGSVRLHL